MSLAVAEMLDNEEQAMGLLALWKAREAALTKDLDHSAARQLRACMTDVATAFGVQL